MGFRKGLADILGEFKQAFREALDVPPSSDSDNLLNSKKGIRRTICDYWESARQATRELYGMFVAGKDVEGLKESMLKLGQDLEQERTRRQELELQLSQIDLERERTLALDAEMKYAQFGAWTKWFYTLGEDLAQIQHELRVANAELDDFKKGERRLDLQRGEIEQRRTRLARQSELLETYAKKVKAGIFYEQARSRSSEAFTEWKKTAEAPLVAKVAESDREADAAKLEAKIMKGAAIQVAVEFMVQRYEAAQNVPFVYYDFNTRYLVLTPAAKKLLGIRENEEYGIERFLLSIRGNRKKEGDRKRINQVVSTIREGDRLVQQHMKTSRGQDLYLTSYPYPPKDARHPSVNVDPKYRNALGVGIFLYDPAITSPVNYLKKPRHTPQVATELTEVCGGVLERLRTLYPKLQPVRAT